MIPVEVLGVQADPSHGSPVVLLQEQTEPHRSLPIFVGAAEAASIVLGMTGTASPRPLTHDLLVTVLDRTDARLDRVDVTEVHDGVFHAELSVTSATGTHRVPSRPSDAIALAVRLGVPVFAAEDVLDEAGALLLDDTDDADDTGRSGTDEAAIEEQVAAFADLLEGLRPEDFGGQPGEPGA